MIRSLLLAAGFLIVTISLLLLQPSSPSSGNNSDYSGTPVTRSEVGISDAVPVSQTNPSPALPQDVATLVAPQTASNSFAEADPVQDRVAMMTQNILQELRSMPVSTTESAPPPAPAGIASKLSLAAKANMSLTELEQMLRQAVAQGEVTPEGAFVNTFGEIDYAALLAKYLPEPVSSVAAPVSQDFLYRVQPGDSLAGLAMTFFGDAREYQHIIVANSGAVSPNQPVAMGILLTIPAL